MIVKFNLALLLSIAVSSFAYADSKSPVFLYCGNNWSQCGISRAECEQIKESFGTAMENDGFDFSETVNAGALIQTTVYFTSGCGEGVTNNIGSSMEGNSTNYLQRFIQLDLKAPGELEPRLKNLSSDWIQTKDFKKLDVELKDLSAELGGVQITCYNMDSKGLNSLVSCEKGILNLKSELAQTPFHPKYIHALKIDDSQEDFKYLDSFITNSKAGILNRLKNADLTP
jgi:hypothetical protein